MATEAMVGCALIEEPGAFAAFIMIGLVVVAPWIHGRYLKLTPDDEE